MKLFEQIKVKEQQPETSGWYNTDDGELYFFKGKISEYDTWSCREDRKSDEFPTYWYKEYENKFKTSKEIIEGNDLIDEFIGLNPYKESSVVKFSLLANIPLPKDYRRYDLSYDWLMPVYNKIAKEKLYKNNENGILLFNILCDSIIDADDILIVWGNLVKFLKWYKP